MSTPVKLKPEEISNLEKIQESYKEITYSFGQLQIEQLNINYKLDQLNRLKEQLTEDFSKLQKTEQEWISSILNSYGEGNLSLETKTFIPK